MTGFGIGSKWQLPLQAFSGSVPAATSDGQLAGETIGQGVQVSPLGMALIAAEVDSGILALTGARHRPARRGRVLPGRR